jgi:hypothetical protein
VGAIEALDSEVVRAFLAERYRARSAHLAVVGDAEVIDSSRGLWVILTCSEGELVSLSSPGQVGYAIPIRVTRSRPAETVSITQR